MAKKILILTGSPRKEGNTATLVEWVSDAAKRAGAKVETIDVAKLEHKVNGCICCMGCQKSEAFECVIDDEIAGALKRIPQAGVIVFATPTYFFGPSAQLKLLLDRMFCLFKFNPADGSFRTVFDAKKPVMAVVASAAGDTNEGLGMVRETFKHLEGFFAERVETLLVPKAPLELGELAADDEWKQKAHAFGEALAKA